MWIKLNTPYKIIFPKEKRYQEHYHIPASKCVIIPLTKRDDEVVCNVHWEENDALYGMCNVMFTAENLEPLTPGLHVDLISLWEQIYQSAVPKING